MRSGYAVYFTARRTRARNDDIAVVDNRRMVASVHCVIEQGVRGIFIQAVVADENIAVIDEPRIFAREHAPPHQRIVFTRGVAVDVQIGRERIDDVFKTHANRAVVRELDVIARRL